MKEVDGICRKHNIEYVLFAGTALGAQRHGGFIPWDDDADIIMTRDNYRKFLSIIDEELPEDRAIDCLEKDTDYLFTYARYVDTSTTAIQRHTAFGGCHPGIKLDIFCVVPTMDDPEEIKKHQLDILAFSEVVCTTGRMMTYRPEGFYERYREEAAKAGQMGREAYIRQTLPELMDRGAENSEKCILFSGMASNTKLYDSSIFESSVYVPYEDTSLPISAENVLFSEQHFGKDWIALPADIAEPKHTFLLDTAKPYTYYLPKLERKLDIEAAKAAAIAKKENNLYEKDVFRDVLGNGQKIRNAAAAVETEANLKALADDADASAVCEACEPFYYAQMTRASKVHRLAVPLKHEDFVRATGALIQAGRYYDAESILKVCIEAGYITADDDFAKKSMDRISACRELIQTMCLTEDENEVSALLDETLIGDTASFAIAKAWKDCRAAVLPEEYLDVLKYIEKEISRFGNIGELLLTAAICLEELNLSDDARNRYEDAIKTVRNGFAFQQIVNKGIDFSIIFEQAKAKEQARRKVSIPAAMRGDRKKVSGEIIGKAREEGCLSMKKKIRYGKYKMWKKNRKDAAEKAFSEYAEKLFSLS